MPAITHFTYHYVGMFQHTLSVLTAQLNGQCDFLVDQDEHAYTFPLEIVYREGRIDKLGREGEEGRERSSEQVRERGTETERSSE